MSRSEYTIVLRPEPKGRDVHGREPAYRLKLALKTLLRQFGLRCVEPIKLSEQTETSQTAGKPAKDRDHEGD